MRHLSVIFIILNITVRIALKNLNCYKIHINLFHTASTNRPIPMHRMRPKTDASKTEASIRPSSRPFRPVGRNASHAFAAMLFRRILPDFARLLQVWRKKPSAGEDGAFEECEMKMARNKSLMPADRRRKRDRGQDACRQVHSDMYAKANGMRRNEEAVRRWGAAATWKEFHTRKQRGPGRPGMRALSAKPCFAR